MKTYAIRVLLTGLIFQTFIYATSLTKLHLQSSATTLNVAKTAELTLMGTYSDNTTKTVTQDIAYVIAPTNSVEINGTVLTAKKDGNVTVQAKVGNTLSNKVNLNITWIVDRHVLPPEPDPKVNNSTLLGIDSNNNGVRDDVERWIYKTYDEYIPCHQELDYNNTATINGEVIPSAVQVCEEHPIPYHPIVRAVAMQGARATQIIIQEPEKAKELMKYYDNAHFCAMYISLEKKQQYIQDVIPVIKKDIFKEGEGFISKLFNTSKRARAYAKYNYYLSGGVYRIPTESEIINGCDSEVRQLLKEFK